ncbi:MAG: peptidylprolyl isomerase [Burkholderiales bacterium]|nr:peptidylprolyl isomerase [Burkholderiales bacterium]
MTLPVAANHWVQVRYRLFDSQGQEIEAGERELTYLHGGYGAVFERIEEALEGLQAGQTASLYLEPADSFGDYEPDLVRLAPRDLFPDDLEAGMSFEGLPGEEGVDASDDDGLIYTVTDFTDDTVVLDGNHPLAGMGLRFDLRVVDVRLASEEEIEREQQAGE